MWGRDMDSLPFAPSLYWVWVLFWKAQHIYLFSAGRWRGYSFNFYFYFFSLSKRGCSCWRIHNQMAPWSHVPRFKPPSLSLSLHAFPHQTQIVHVNELGKFSTSTLIDTFFSFYFPPFSFFIPLKKNNKINWR